jgi:hypothetical protein
VEEVMLIPWIGWLAVAAGTPVAQSHSLQLPSPAIFGKSTADAVKLLEEKKLGDIEPFVVWSDVRCGRYFAMSAFYGKPVNLADVRAEVNRRYGQFESKYSSADLGLWRVEPEKFAIQAAVGEEDSVRLTFIHFLTEKERSKWILRGITEKNLSKEQRPELEDVLGEDPCIEFGEAEKP